MSEVELVGQAGSPESTLGHLMPRGPGDGQVEMSSAQKVERKDHAGWRHVENHSIAETAGGGEGEKQPEVCSGVLQNREWATLPNTPDRAGKQMLQSALGSW